MKDFVRRKSFVSIAKAWDVSSPGSDRDMGRIANVAPRRRKYVFTAQLVLAFEKSTLPLLDLKTLPGIRQLAQEVGIPYWALKKHARELGLTRTKEQPFSEPKFAVLARYGWMSDECIRLKLKSAGHMRTVTAIHLKLRLVRSKSDPSFYSGKGLADALGIDSHVVTRWIKAGHSEHSSAIESARNNRAETFI